MQMFIKFENVESYKMTSTFNAPRPGFNQLVKF